MADFLIQHPELLDNRTAILDLAYEEYCLREEAGEVLDADEFCQRFPRYQSTIRRLLVTHSLLRSPPSERPLRTPLEMPGRGDTFLSFQIKDELGRGAFGRVFLAEDTTLGNRQVAVKVSRHGKAEAGLLGKLAHPNIVPVHSVQHDVTSGLSAICMPYLGRTTLLDVLESLVVETLPKSGATITRVLQATNPGARVEAGLTRYRYEDAVAHLGAQLGEALAHVHAQGILHRDLKPSNVLLTMDARPMLLDFNLSVASSEATVDWGGTLPYMSPEQLRCIPPEIAPAGIDARSDVYSLGVVLHELLAAEHPFGPIPLAGAKEELRDLLLERQRAGAPPSVNPSLSHSHELMKLVQGCLALEPARRPDAATLAKQLREYLS
ncbi:MAG: serine/threonine-protein kinase, partial [Gemmataceae bacterium]